MSYVTCPCGFRADGFAADAMAAYRAHACQHHEVEAPQETDAGGDSWPGTVAFIVLLVAVVAVCLICARWFR